MKIFYMNLMKIGRTYNIPNNFENCRLIPQINASLFGVFCSHSHVFRKTFIKVSHPKITPNQACLTMEFLWNGLPKQDESCW